MNNPPTPQNVQTLIKDIESHIRKIDRELDRKFGKCPWKKIKSVVKGMK